METLLRLARVWWTGFKVFCYWCAFGIVLWGFWLLLAILAYLAGDCVGKSLGTSLAILLAPIPFYFISKYLPLPGDRERDTARSTEYTSEAAGREGTSLRVKIMMSVVVAFLCGWIVSPPDIVSEITDGGLMALLCGVPLLILSRFRFMKSASPSMHSLVCILICAVGVLFTTCLLFASKIFGL